jgi:hypothetical protein
MPTVIGEATRGGWLTLTGVVRPVAEVPLLCWLVEERDMPAVMRPRLELVKGDRR